MSGFEKSFASNVDICIGFLMIFFFKKSRSSTC